MTDTQQQPDRTAPAPHAMSRMQLMWQLLVFQVKLAADGLRDVMLVPVSLLAALAGLLTSRDDPAKYYREVLRLGRRSEYWINLFGYRKGRGTADEILEPLQEKVFAQAENNPHIKRANETVNRSLDKSIESVSEVVEKRFTGKPPDPD